MFVRHQHQAHVQRDAASLLFVYDEGIDVKFCYLGEIDHHLTHAQQRVDDGILIDRALAAIAVEKGAGADLTQQR